jgi:hypothetical protein
LEQVMYIAPEKDRFLRNQFENSEGEII